MLNAAARPDEHAPNACQAARLRPDAGAGVEFGGVFPQVEMAGVQAGGCDAADQVEPPGSSLATYLPAFAVRLRAQ